MFNRVIVLVMDGVGVGAAPDAIDYGDSGANTLGHVDQEVGGLDLPNLQKIGLGNISDLINVKPTHSPAIFGKMRPRSVGKDTTSGHWEIAGFVNDAAFATFPDGFPRSLLDEITQATGYSWLGNYPASGTDIIRQLGDAHVASGSPILYTSADSVLQIAAHTSVVPLDEQYRVCEVIRPIADKYNICRVIARPFAGGATESGSLTSYARVYGRRDFGTLPLRPTILDALSDTGIPVLSVGKISDIFCGRGITKSYQANGNREAMSTTIELISNSDEGFIFTNLVDFDTKYGHRLDCAGFAKSLMKFDDSISKLMKSMSADDLLIITADHGCDPLSSGIDHTREEVPLLVWHSKIRSQIDLGTRNSFCDIAATIAENFCPKNASFDSSDSFFTSLKSA